NEFNAFAHSLHIVGSTYPAAEYPTDAFSTEIKENFVDLPTIKNAAEKAMKDILPIIDDFDRAIQANAATDDVQAVREGVELIYNKLIKYLESNGVKEMATTGEAFDADIHEAVTTFPAPSEDLKGKIIDTVQKGYSINDKVLRHAKVVVGQ
ncbi:MAG: nucleotide exchange factor GrpE, partial [Muribaculaceae bacterium]|nr:nucleotide exchange factor GrpE [Muribaculaceae bacterium]